MWRPWMRASASSRLSSLSAVSRRISTRGNPAAANSRSISSGVGNLAASMRLDRGEERLQPVGLEVVGMERADRDAAVVRHDAARLGERLRAVDEVEHERHRHAVEPAVTERQPLGARPPDADAGRERLARDGDHLGALVDAPRLRMRLADEGGEQPSRAAADVERRAGRGGHRARPSPRMPPTTRRRSAAACRRCGRGRRSRVGRPRSLLGLRASPGRGSAGRRGERAPARRARRRGSRSRRSPAARRWRGTLARLLRDLRAEVPGREVGQSEQPDARCLRGERSLRRGRVVRLAGALPLVGAERRLVDQQVDARSLPRRPRRPAPCRR